MRPTTLGVIGLGAIGGSLAWQARGSGIRVLGWSPRPAERVRAVQLGALDDAPTSPEDVARRADLLVIAAPAAATVELLARLAGSLRPGALVTDVARVKVWIARQARALGLSDRFAGSHPFVDTRGVGFDAARADLLRGTLVYVCPAGDDLSPVHEVTHFWEAVMGAHTVVLDPERHDEQAAWTSHLPHVVAGALASALAAHLPDGATLSPLAREMIGSDPTSLGELLDSLPTNSEAMIKAVGALESELGLWRSGLQAGDADALRRRLAAAGKWRRSLGE
jgi:prephenate dehydrogenase